MTLHHVGECLEEVMWSLSLTDPLGTAQAIGLFTHPVHHSEPHSNIHYSESTQYTQYVLTLKLVYTLY